MSSIYTLTVLSLHRWLLVTRPLSHGQLAAGSARAALLSLAAVWGMALVVAVPPAAGWAYYAPETSGIS